jgi:hypothetical protein
MSGAKIAQLRHLARRYREMGTPVKSEADDSACARSHLTDAEMMLWSTMDVRDRRHAVIVTKRFLALVPHATRADCAAALLHDVGKAQSSLGRTGRVLATLFGGVTSSFRTYLQHEELGARAVAGIGGDPRTVALIRGSVDDDVMHALRDADDV